MQYLQHEDNLEILELIDKYTELADYVETLEGGRMILNEAGINKVLQEEANSVAIMANLSTSANHKANVA